MLLYSLLKPTNLFQTCTSTQKIFGKKLVTKPTNMLVWLPLTLTETSQNISFFVPQNICSL